MDTLYNEVYEYLKVYLSSPDLKKETIIPLISNYGDYITNLLPKKLPLTLYKYINIPYMIHDLHEDGDILVFCFSPHDDTETLYSAIEYDTHENTEGFINGVKLLDESDIREQITANIYTGGFWDETIHWVVDLRTLVKD
jgi:hypothetical protein